MKNENRVLNFNPGPGMLPPSVLEEFSDEILRYKASGVGICELSHRSKVFDEVLDSIKARISSLAVLPKSYEVIFMTGGASTQFSAVPLNLLNKDSVKKAYYLISGVWAEKAYEEALIFADAKICGSSKDTNFSELPQVSTSLEDVAYVHYTSNNTIYGTQFSGTPQVGNVPIVCDASSDIFSRPIDLSSYVLVYAGAQKQLGAAGVTMVILNPELIKKGPCPVPKLLRYETYVSTNSLYNTPPVIQIVLLDKMLGWIESEGGLQVMGERNTRKSNLLYDFLDSSSLYEGTASKKSRSQMNITFRLNKPELEGGLLEYLSREGVLGVAGHRSVGGCRVSLYNAVPEDYVMALVEMLREFERIA